MADTEDGIYLPKEDSYLLQKYVRKYAWGKVLDMGTGSGIQALTAAKNRRVKEAVAVDINDKAVEKLKEKIKEEIKKRRIPKENLRKIKAVKSDLFSKVKGKFDLLAFNPPYLPQDKGIKDSSIYGGKKGWELSEKFFKEASGHLFPEGKILFLFSSLTNKKKIEEIIKNNLFVFREVGRQKLYFEELYVYLAEKSSLLKELERKGVKNIHYFTHGQRGDIFIGEHKNKKIAIKARREESRAEKRLPNEAKWLRLLNRQNIGPKLLFFGKVSGKDYLACRFAEGKFILDFIREKEEKNKNDSCIIRKVIVSVLKQCFLLDRLGANKEEMHRPLKHIIIRRDNQPVLIDFERSHKTSKPHNVTQFAEFIARIARELKKKGIKVNPNELRMLAGEYKKSFSEDSLENIIKAVSC